MVGWKIEALILDSTRCIECNVMKYSPAQHISATLFTTCGEHHKPNQYCRAAEKKTVGANKDLSENAEGL
jgi:hypothetical protein